MRRLTAIAWIMLLPAAVLPLVAQAPRECPCPRDGAGQCPCREQCRCVLAQAKVGGRVSPDGQVELQLDLPGSLHRKNVASAGLGCCVFTSIHHAALWQGVAILQEFPAWMLKEHIAGGGWPDKVAKLITQKCKQAGCAEPDYIQVQGADLEILKLCCQTGRMPGVTYSVSPTGRYSGQKIAHMVNLAHADDKYFVVLDNNYLPSKGHEREPDNYEWMTPAEFARSYTGMGGGWAVILLDSGPPPVPRNPRK